MVVALLIGFKYKREFKELPGIIVDLYHAYSFIKKINADIHILTDIITDENVMLLKNAVFNGVVKADIISFITDIKNNGEHLTYKDLDNFIDSLAYITNGVKKLFLYYTGHGENGSLILPQFQKLSLKHFRNIILFNMDPNGELFSIMDCCNGAHMGIPFILKDNDYRLIDRRFRFFTKQSVIHLVSSLQDENSVITGDGSIFTAVIFELLCNGDRNLKHLVSMVTKTCLALYPQTASLYVSKPNIYLFWRWLLYNSTEELYIQYYPELDSLSIQLKNNNQVNDEVLSVCYDNNFKSSLKF